MKYSSSKLGPFYINTLITPTIKLIVVIVKCRIPTGWAWFQKEEIKGRTFIIA